MISSATMMPHDSLSRRSFLALSAAAPLAPAMAKSKHIPVGLELFSVREELKQDLMGTVRGVAKMGYECVEFFAPYFDWTPAYAKDVKKLMDDVGIRCLSTHNSDRAFTAENLPHAIEINQIIGSEFIVMASAVKPGSSDARQTTAARMPAQPMKSRISGSHEGFAKGTSDLTLETRAS